LYKISYNEKEPNFPKKAQTNSKKELKGVKIEKIDENCLKISLSCTEMLRMNAESTSNESSILIAELMEALEKELQFSLMNQEIVLEMIPSPKDGCEIFLTKTESKKQKRYEKNLAIISFPSSEEVFFAESLSAQYARERSAVYLMNGEYYLVICSQDYVSLSKVQLILSDLGNTVDNPLLMEGVLKEYGTLISEEDAPPLLT